jgi:hypothetical protein
VLFIFRKSKLVLDCFTSKEYVFKNNKINYANQFYPEWWKNIPKEVMLGITPTGTLKKCQGLIDTYKIGAMLPLWSDLAINIQNKKFEWQFADFMTNCVQHNPKQWGAFADPNVYGNMKIESFWKCKTKTDTNFYYTSPFWNSPINRSYETLSGTLNFKYQHDANINIMLNTSKDGHFVLKQGTPMIHLIPITDKQLIIKHHLIDDKEINNMSGTFMFTNSYKMNKQRILKEESKCPFGFLKRTNIL